MAQQASKTTTAARPYSFPGALLLSVFWALSLNYATGLPAPPPEQTPGQEIESCQLPAPADFTAQPGGNASAVLSWSPAPGATAYQLTVYNLQTLEIVCDRTETGAGAVLQNLQSGVSYRCVLASKCSMSSTSSLVIIVDLNI